MIKSICVWAYAPNRPLREVFEMAAAQGFEGVEVAIAMDGQITPQTSTEQCQAIAEMARQNGLVLTSLASGLGWSHPVITTDPDTFAQNVQVNRDSLRVARDLGVDGVLMVPGRVTPEISYDVAYDATLKALRELAPYAEEMGVTIGVENVWNKFLLSPLEFRDLLDEVNSPRVGCYFDVGNVLLTGFPDQWIEILGHRIAKIHFKDFKNEIGNISGFCNLLEGDVPFPQVIEALKKVGYDGSVVSEFFDVESDLPAISQAMDKILGRA